MLPDRWINQLKSNDWGLQLNATLLHPLDDETAYSIMPLMIEKAKEVDVDHGAIDIKASSFVGRSATNAARLIRERGYSDQDKFHREVRDWILELNYCSEINVAAHSVIALGNLWVPPESVRTRLIELVNIQRRSDNELEHPGTIRGTAFRQLASRDRKTAQQLIDTPARREFQESIIHQLEIYGVKYPNNEKVPHDLKAEIEWLTDANAE